MACGLESQVLVDRKCSFGALRIIVILATAALALSTVAVAQNEERAKAGLTTWKSAGCADCHGKFADGNPDDDDYPIGADLRTTRLDATALRQTIRCGRLGTGMPSFDEGAYVVRGCYGRPTGARPDSLQPTPRNLALEEIDDVIAYLQTRIIGRGKITREECVAYFDGQSDECEDYK
jgi:mono/diheme cytochrome c family protein